MSRRSLAALPLAAAGLSACAHPGDDGPGREAQILALLKQWADARVAGDVAFLERFYAPELQLETAAGTTVSRAEDIALFAARDIRPEFIRNTETRVQFYGRTAIATGFERLEGTYKGHPGDMTLRMTNVLVRRDGRWQLVASHSSLNSGTF